MTRYLELFLSQKFSENDEYVYEPQISFDLVPHAAKPEDTAATKFAKRTWCYRKSSYQYSRGARLPNKQLEVVVIIVLIIFIIIMPVVYC